MDQRKAGKAPGHHMQVFGSGTAGWGTFLYMLSEYNFKNFNFRLLFYALALNVIRLLVINSAVNGDRSYINRQLIGLFGGLVIMIFLALMDYHKLMRCTGVIYLACVAILLAIIVAGQFGGAGTGARRWITSAIGRFQPSEFVKIGLIIFFSGFLQRNQERSTIPAH